jgi:hypothetical protein
MWETNFTPIQHSRQICKEGGHNGKAVFRITRNYCPFNQCSLCWTKAEVYFNPTGIKKGRCQLAPWSPVVTIHYVPPVKHSTVLPSDNTVYLCVLCGSENKQRLFHCTALTDWFL